MKKIVVFSLAIIITFTLALVAQNQQKNSAPGATSQSVTIEGTLVDVACATENAAHPVAGFAAKHDKSCLQMPDCENSGYAVLTPDNKVIKFSSGSNAATKKLIAESEKKDDWKIKVTGVVEGDTITVQSLALQP
jgi:hypothetical protein